MPDELITPKDENERRTETAGESKPAVTVGDLLAMEDTASAQGVEASDGEVPIVEPVQVSTPITEALAAQQPVEEVSAAPTADVNSGEEHPSGDTLDAIEDVQKLDGQRNYMARLRGFGKKKKPKVIKKPQRVLAWLRKRKSVKEKDTLHDADGNADAAEAKSVALQDRAKKYSMLLVVIIGFIVFAGVLIELLLDMDVVKRRIIAATNERITDRELVIEGDISLNLFPEAYFEASQVHLKNSPNAHHDYIFSVNKIRADFSPMSLIFGAVDIEKILLSKPVVRLEMFEGEEPNWEIATNVNAQEDNFAVNVESNNAEIYVYSGSKDAPVERLMTLKSARVKSNSTYGPYSARGDISNAATGFTMNYAIDVGKLIRGTAVDISFKADAKNETLMLKGKVKNWHEAPVLAGALKVDSQNPAKTISHFVGVESKNFGAEIFDDEQTVLEGGLTLSAKGVAVMDAAFSSPNFTGNLAWKTAFDTVDKNDITLRFEVFNIDGVMQGKLNTLEDPEGSGSKFISNIAQLSLRENVDSSLLLEIDKVTYKAAEFGKVILNASVEKGSAKVDKFSIAGLPGTEAFFLQGQLLPPTEKTLAYALDSRVQIRGEDARGVLMWLGFFEEETFAKIPDNLVKNFAVDANVNISDAEFFVKKAVLMLDKVKASAQYRTQGGGRVGNSALRIVDVNLDAYITPFYDEVVDGSKPALETIASTQGQEVAARAEAEVLDDVLIKFDAIRNIGNYFDKFGLALNVDKLRFRGKDFSNASTVMQYGGGVLVLNKASIVSDSGKITGNMRIDTGELKPYITTNVNFETLDSEFLLDIYNYKRPYKKVKRFGHWSEVPFNFNGLRIFTGQVNVQAAKVIHKNVTMQKLESTLKVGPNNINIETFKVRAFNSTLVLRGSIGTKRPSINLTYQIANAHFPKIVKTFFGFRALKSGRASMSGTLTASGYTQDAWMSSLKGNIALIVRDAAVRGANMKLLTEKLPQLIAVKDVRYWGHKALSGKGTLKLGYLSANALINNGVIEAKDVVLDDELIEGSKLNVILNLADWAIDLGVTFYLRAVNTLSGNDKLEYSGLAVPLTINGDIDRPFVYWKKDGIENYWERKFFRGR